MSLQDHDRFPDALHRLKRVPGIALGNELEDALQMPDRARAQLDRASAQPDRCHAFGRGRLVLRPRARAAR